MLFDFAEGTRLSDFEGIGGRGAPTGGVFRPCINNCFKLGGRLSSEALKVSKAAASPALAAMCSEGSSKTGS